MRAAQPSQPRQGRRREQGPRQAPRAAFLLPSERDQEAVRKEQLEYARAQAAAERRAESAPSDEQSKEKEKEVPALFGVVGTKTG